MAGTAKPPAANLVRQFLLGRLPEPEHTEVEQLLAETVEWLAVAEADAGKDDLLGALSGLGAIEEPPLSPAVGKLMARLERLGPAVVVEPARVAKDLAAVTVAEPETADTAPTLGPEKGSSVPSAEYPFLSPAKQKDELGWLGSYRVFRQLGAGGMGIVFAGEDSLLKRPVALKVMRPEAAAYPNACRRFIREAQAAAALDHPNVVQIHQVVETPVPFIAMTLLAGESLADLLKRAPLVPIGDVLRIGKEAAQGLAAAHAAGLIHRDIKPGNLWLATTPVVGGQSANAGPSESKSAPCQVKILDFGLARQIDEDSALTHANTILGTPAYMAPEQANGLALTARSDLFSLGCVLYQLATGNMPFTGPTATAVLMAVAEYHPPSPHSIRAEVPPALSHLIMQLLSKEADKRPQSAQMVAQTLASLETAGVTLSTVLSATSFGFAGPRTRRLLLLAAAIFAIGAVALGLFFALRPGPQNQSSGPGTSPISQQPTPPVYRGNVDIQVWRTSGEQVRKLRLTDLGALPLMPGDMFRVTARIEPAAYLYLLWIDQEGMTDPVYPWVAGQWGTRPSTEIPVDGLDLPAQATKGFTISKGPEGMETLIMLALDAPLTAADEDLKSRLGGLPPQRRVQNALSAVWFENGKVVENDQQRQRANFDLADINDPVLRLQERLRLQLQPLARYSAAVSFARQGKK